MQLAEEAGIDIDFHAVMKSRCQGLKGGAS